MIYYVFKITPGPTELVRNIELISDFEAYQDAKKYCRSQRAKQQQDSAETWKMVFAASQLEAEEKLHERRDKPILRSWEK